MGRARLVEEAQVAKTFQILQVVGAGPREVPHMADLVSVGVG